MKRRHAMGRLAGLGAALALPVHAQANKVFFGYTAVAEFASLFVAKEEGYFTKRGLDVEPKLIPLNSTIPAALVSDSLQLGGPTVSVFLQAVDGGLDLVVVAGGGATDKKLTTAGLVARTGSPIKAAADCVGKRIAVPGLNSLLHVTFRAYLTYAGVDWKEVSFVEVPFPQHNDVLRGGSIDAVVTADPFMTRILESGAGTLVAHHSTYLSEGMPTVLYAAPRVWVQKNPVLARAFREAIVEAAAFMQKPGNDPAVRTHMAKYIRMPPEILAKAQIAPAGPVVTERQLAYWVSMMKRQEMLRGEIKTATLIAS